MKEDYGLLPNVCTLTATTGFGGGCWTSGGTQSGQFTTEWCARACRGAKPEPFATTVAGRGPHHPFG